METGTSSGKENAGLALSGMILGAIGFICAFIPAWRTIGMVIAFLSLCVSVFALSRINKAHGKKVRALAGIVLSIAGILVASYFLFLTKPDVPEKPEAEPMPTELQHSDAHESDHANALEKLEGLTDSTSASE
jgi:hypothetical protein